MNRRFFLNLLGVGAAAAVVEASRFVPRAQVPGFPEPGDDIYKTTLALGPEGASLEEGFAGCFVPAPPGRQCRLEVLPSPDVTSAAIWCARSANNIGEVLIDRVALKYGEALHSLTAGPLDLAVLNSPADDWISVHWDRMTGRRPLVIDYTAFPGARTTGGFELDEGPLLTLGFGFSSKVVS